MPRTRHLDINTIESVGSLGNLRALHVPVDGSDISFRAIKLIRRKDEYGESQLFPDGREIWGTDQMRRGTALLVGLLLPGWTGQYYVYGTDVLSGLPLNVHLMHRPPGIYGDALIIRTYGGNPSFVSVPKKIMTPYILRELLLQINSR